MDILDILAAMREYDGQDSRIGAPTCPNDGSLWTISYPGCIKESSNILPLITRYKYEDACKAVFCINSWYQNRSVQSCIASSNAALLCAEFFGENAITTYEDFKAFYKEFAELNPVSPREDYVIPVMGHTKLYYGGRWWPALYGCGMTHEYSRLCFADSVCQKAQKVNEFQALLGYTTAMATALDGGGWDGVEICDVALCLPSEAHWNNTTAWFKELSNSQMPSSIKEVLSNRYKPIENIHFVEHEGMEYPLFNPSILTDYFGYCCELLDTQALVNATDAHLALNADLIYTSTISRQAGLFLWPCFKLANKYIENCPVAFMLFDDTGCLTVFYDLFFGDGNLNELREALMKHSSEIQVYESYEREGKHRGLSFRKWKVKTVTLVAFMNDIVPVTQPCLLETSKVSDVTCGALDLLSIIHAASSIEEVNTYFNSLKKTRSNLIAATGGIFPHFWYWKVCDYNIFAGAEDVDKSIKIFSDYNDNDFYYTELFNGDVRHYPFISNTYPSGSPFCCRFEKTGQGFVMALTKAEDKLISVSKRLSEKPCFLQLRDDFAVDANMTGGEIEREIEARSLSQDILEKLVDSIEGEFCKFAEACGGIVCFEYVHGTSEKAEYLDLIDEELGIRVKAFDVSFVCIYYSFDIERFLNAVADAADRTVECRLGAAIVSAIKANYPIVNNLIHMINSLRYEKKLVDVQTVEMPYVWHRSADTVGETGASKKAALKTVAIAADSAGIRPGTYLGKDANEILRKFEGNLTSILKKELGKYQAETLVKDLYDTCGSSSHKFYIHTKRIASFTRIDEREASRLSDDVLDLRDNAREHTRASRYCIETVLAYGINGAGMASSAELAYLLSLAIQCLGVSDIADALRFNPQDLSVKVEDNKTVRILESDELTSRSRDIKKRSIIDSGHVLEDVSVDIDYTRRSQAAFEKDTGVSFGCLLGVLNELALGVESNEIFSFVRPNVVSVSKEGLATHLCETLSDITERADVLRCIEFLTIDDSILNSINGVILDYVPFGRIKDRPNRLELKPLILFSNMLVYSPVCAGMLRMRWMEGITQRFLPTKAYASLYSVSEQWKKHYEKALEKDVRDCFLSHGFNEKYVFRDLQLKKHGNYPQCLGDYDGLAYDGRSETVWCIECKEYEKVESAFDTFQLQERWFGKGGKLLQYERRVHYLNDHLNQIADDLNFQHSGTLKVRPYLVCNKLFMNMIGESSFDVITVGELDNLLCQSIKP